MPLNVGKSYGAKVAISHDVANTAQKLQSETTKAAPELAPAPIAPTAAELEKAKKASKLTAQYVPGAPTGTNFYAEQADKMIAGFNKKYEGKTDLTPEQLHEKVVDFKALTAAMAPLKKGADELAAKEAAKAAETAKNKAEAAKKAKEDFVKNLSSKPAEEQRRYWLTKSAGPHWVSQGESLVASHPFLQQAGVTPAEAGFIAAFTGPKSGVNEQMRKGFMSQEVFNFKHIMNAALEKMPKHDGSTLYRKIDLDEAGKAEYVPGEVVHWKSFNSASDNPKTWTGNTHFTIRNPQSGVDVRMISEHPSEDEVILPADTYYHVISKKTVGGTTHIEMEELLPIHKMKKAA